MSASDVKCEVSRCGLSVNDGRCPQHGLYIYNSRCVRGFGLIAQPGGELHCIVSPTDCSGLCEVCALLDAEKQSVVSRGFAARVERGLVNYFD